MAVPARKSLTPKLSDAAQPRPMGLGRLLRYASKRRPPQMWYEEAADPTKPARKK